MHEARRFLRYLIPGVTFLIQVVLFFYISDHGSLISVLEKHLLIAQSVGTPITLLIASGGIGFLFSSCHHLFYWLVYARCCPHLAITHARLVRTAEKLEYVRILSYDGAVVAASCLKPASRWGLVTAFWHGQQESSPKIKGANQRIDSLCDLMHGAGAALFSCLVSIALWVHIKIVFVRTPFTLLDAAAPLFLIIFHFLNYYVLVNHTKNVAETIVLDELKSFYDETGKPINLFVRDSQLKKRHERKPFGT